MTILQPLADRLRPKNIEDVVGQEHILGSGKLLKECINSGKMPTMIFYGPPGTGKTTVAEIISNVTDQKLYKLNATTTSISDIKNIFLETTPILSPNGILLYLDEIQYFNKKQQQSLLEFVENGMVTLIASTTENPHFYVYNALLSRAIVFEFKSIPHSQLKTLMYRAINFIRQENSDNLQIEKNAVDKIINIANGDARKLINIVELCYTSLSKYDNNKTISINLLDGIYKNLYTSYSKDGDSHYDLLSAFQKSMRGSDADAAIYYLAKLLEAGELLSVCRRLLVCACEDVGLAYANVIPIVKACTDIALQVGLPEAKIPLADAVIMVSLSPKSNSAYNAINRAIDALKNGKDYPIPRTLINEYCDGHGDNNNFNHYKYPHNYINSWINQQYLPDELKNIRYYEHKDNKNENLFYEYWKKIKNY